MEPPLIDDIESSLNAQRTELADHLRQFREGVRFNNVAQGLAEGAVLKADALAASIASVLIRNPVPLVITGSAVLLFLARRNHSDRRAREPSSVATNLSPVPHHRELPHSALSRITDKAVQAAGDVFGNWAAAVSMSIERFAVELTRQVAQSMVRTLDTMIASGFERLAQSLSQAGKV